MLTGANIGTGQNFEIGAEYLRFNSEKGLYEVDVDYFHKMMCEKMGHQKKNLTMIDKLMHDTTLKLTDTQKQSIQVMGDLLLNAGYEPAFVAGILANIVSEGTIGLFESSNYDSNPSQKKKYIQYMDDNYNYRKKYSYKNISEVGIADTYQMLLELESLEYLGMFGLGVAQWTGPRALQLVEVYIEVAGENSYPTREQAIKAESLMIIRELNGTFSNVYPNWCNRNSDLKSESAAKDAGAIVCTQYEKPSNYQAKAGPRGDLAKAIYKVMIGE